VINKIQNYKFTSTNLQIYIYKWSIWDTLVGFWPKYTLEKLFHYFLGLKSTVLKAAQTYSVASVWGEMKHTQIVPELSSQRPLSGMF